jgi:hypothetical protein
MNTEHAIDSAELDVTETRKTLKWPFVAVFILLIGFLAYIDLSPDDSRAPTTNAELCIFNAGVNLNGVSIPENPIRVSPSLSVEKLYVCFGMEMRPTPDQGDKVKVLIGEILDAALAGLSKPDETGDGFCLTAIIDPIVVVAELTDSSFVEIERPKDRCGNSIW